MATPHLISDYSPEDGYAEEDTLGSVAMTEGGDTHLVTLEQSSAWTNKVFVVTPKEAKYAACMATGIEAYPNVRGGSNVMRDTDNLINAVGTCLNSLSWRSGYRPVVSSFMRGTMKGPYSHRSGIASSNSRAEYIYSAAAYRFNLKHLHFSKMSSFTAKLRVYVPSSTVKMNGDNGLYHCELDPGPLYGDAGKLCCRLSSTLPALQADVADGYDRWEFAGAANGGISVSGNPQYLYHSVMYNPYHGDDCGSMPVWTANQRSASPTTAAPQMYYYDFTLTNADNLAVLGKNPSDVWAVVHFHRGNGVANATANLGLWPNSSYTLWMYRADIVLSCTCAKF